MAIEARLGSPENLRAVLRDAKVQIVDVFNNRDLGSRISRVIWELLTNLRHGDAGHGRVRVLIDANGIVLHLPGHCFDSTEGHNNPDARGLRTASYLVHRSGWCWTHCYLNNENKITLEPMIGEQ